MPGSGSVFPPAGRVAERFSTRTRRTPCRTMPPSPRTCWKRCRTARTASPGGGQARAGRRGRAGRHLPPARRRAGPAGRRAPGPGGVLRRPDRAVGQRRGQGPPRLDGREGRHRRLRPRRRPRRRRTGRGPCRLRVRQGPEGRHLPRVQGRPRAPAPSAGFPPRVSVQFLAPSATNCTEAVRIGGRAPRWRGAVQAEVWARASAIHPVISAAAVSGRCPETMPAWGSSRITLESSVSAR